MGDVSCDCSPSLCRVRAVDGTLSVVTVDVQKRVRRWGIGVNQGFMGIFWSLSLWKVQQWTEVNVKMCCEMMNEKIKVNGGPTFWCYFSCLFLHLLILWWHLYIPYIQNELSLL